ncbi:hypothetical protein B0A48_04171 [Cryoendolithus antarcticus]|uniref:BTB domain-containing protein n=1 Tax=Cryoendolithus antarcticus TaxID=1507870 RepID=A0A1V8THN9_9PEZI|nr:hypothetical protein B0A48_04171 [Cryoendolithus antarcticus]
MLPEKIILSDSGDVVLVLQDERELTVSSHIPSRASTTFEALLGPHFSEGQQPRSSQQPLTVPLPDDDAEAMLDLCSIIHFKSPRDAQNSDGDRDIILRTFGLAVVADKYDAISAVQPSAICSLSRFSPATATIKLPISDLGNLVLIAFLLRLPRHFTAYTSCIVRDRVESYATLLDAPTAERLGAAALAPTKIVLSGAGDVILILQDQTEIVVSSCFLTHASTTFSALLGDQFAEGQQPRSIQNPTRISLPEDDPQSMIDLCSILHLKPLRAINSPGENRKSIVRILALAITTDKYDCIVAVELSVTALLSRYMLADETDNLDIALMSALALAAYYLRLPCHFTIFSSRLVRNYNGPYSKLLGEPFTERVGLATIFHLEQQRSTARNRCMSLLEGMGRTVCFFCTRGTRLLDFHWTATQGLFAREGGFHSIYVNSLKTTLERIASCDIIRCNLECNHAPNSASIGGEQLKRLVTDVKGFAYVLCSDCVDCTLDKCTHQDVLLRHIRENGGA